MESLEFCGMDLNRVEITRIKLDTIPKQTHMRRLEDAEVCK